MHATPNTSKVDEKHRTLFLIQSNENHTRVRNSKSYRITNGCSEIRVRKH